jgi:uncharacterized membrane protein
MEPIIAQAFGPDSSILGRIIAIVVLIGISVFIYMINWSSNQRDSPRQSRERERRAEAIAKQARRELAEQQKPE